MNNQRVSQRDIAAKAGVHFTTVSLALRNSPNLPEETRLRIQKIAEEMGYRPDPMLSALQAYRKTVRTAIHAGTIAWIIFASLQFKTYFSAARQRCEELGYHLEEFSLSNLSPKRLSSILKARNIQGLLIAPHSRNRGHLNFDWDNFSAVTFGYTLSRPRLHVITNAHYSSARMAVRALRKYGYRRIGFFTSHLCDERTDQNFTSGYLAEQRRFSPEDQIPIIIVDDKQPWSQYLKDFRHWYKKYRPDAVLAHYSSTTTIFEDLHIPYEECGLAQLAMDARTTHPCAGVDQNDNLIGRSAVDFLVGMIHRNERGVPEPPLRILVEGKWIEGNTVFHQNLKPKKSKTRRPHK